MGPSSPRGFAGGVRALGRSYRPSRLFTLLSRACRCARSLGGTQAGAAVGGGRRASSPGRNFGSTAVGMAAALTRGRRAITGNRGRACPMSAIEIWSAARPYSLWLRSCCGCREMPRSTFWPGVARARRGERATGRKRFLRAAGQLRPRPRRLEPSRRPSSLAVPARTSATYSLYTYDWSFQLLPPMILAPRPRGLAVVHQAAGRACTSNARSASRQAGDECGVFISFISFTIFLTASPSLIERAAAVQCP